MHEKFNLNQAQVLNIAIEATTPKQAEVLAKFCKQKGNPEFETTNKDTVFMLTTNEVAPVIRTTKQRAWEMGLSVIPFKEQFERPLVARYMPLHRTRMDYNV